MLKKLKSYSRYFGKIKQYVIYISARFLELKSFSLSIVYDGWKFINKRKLFASLSALTLFLIVQFFVIFFRKAKTDIGIGEIGSYISGAAAPILILWLIYSIYIQVRELSSQRQIRIFTTAESILSEARFLLNSEIKNIVQALDIGEQERTVFDLDELPYTLTDSEKFVLLSSVTFDSNSILHQSFRNYVEIYEKSLEMLRRVDSSQNICLFLEKSRYEIISRKIKHCLVSEVEADYSF